MSTFHYRENDGYSGGQRVLSAVKLECSPKLCLITYLYLLVKPRRFTPEHRSFLSLIPQAHDLPMLCIYPIKQAKQHLQFGKG
jgi:hypothetical protein